MTKLPVRLWLETLAARVLPSAGLVPPPAHAADVSHMNRPRHHSLDLTGVAGGVAVTGPTLADGLHELRLYGTAELAGMGRVSVHGTVWSTVSGTVPDAGVLTIRSAAGSVTVDIGRAMPHGNTPGELHYRVVDGTGAYRRDAGHGVLTFALDTSAVHADGKVAGAFTIGLAAKADAPRRQPAGAP